MIKKIPKEIRDEVLTKARAGERIAVLANQYGEQILVPTFTLPLIIGNKSPASVLSTSLA